MEWLFVVLGILLFLLIIVVLNIKIVPQSKAYVIERLGTYHATWETGLHVKIPFLERVAKVVSLKEHVAVTVPNTSFRLLLLSKTPTVTSFPTREAV